MRGYIVNDGSTDNSLAELVRCTQEARDHKISVELINQDNQGVGAAINRGLMEVNGEFLCWPDIDDWLDSDSIRKRVQFLNDNKDYDIVTSDADFFYEDNIDLPQGFVSHKNPERFNTDQFSLLLDGNSMVCPGCHMVRTEQLFESMGGNSIFPSRYGQNLQLLFPILYNRKRGFIDEPLYHYVIYGNSLSHSPTTFEKTMQHRNGRYEIKIETLKRMKMPKKEREKYIRKVTINEISYRLKIGKEYNNKSLVLEQIRWITTMRPLSIGTLIKAYVSLVRVCLVALVSAYNKE